MIAMLRPRDVLEAMLAARFVAVQFHIMDALRSAAELDLPPNLKLRYRASAAAMTRMQDGARRELTRLQAIPALQPAALPVAVPAPRAAPAPAAARADTPRQAAPAARQAAPAPRQANTAATPPAQGGPASLDAATVARLVAEVAARSETSGIALAA
jgi:hypothetical protein